MESIFNQFMHIYFWVFLVISSLGIIKIMVNDYEKSKKMPQISFWGLVSIVVFIMSFKY